MLQEHVPGKPHSLMHPFFTYNYFSYQTRYRIFILHTILQNLSGFSATKWDPYTYIDEKWY